ncbi:MAG: alcohol dehydrogenase catalytic domain-containing protein [Spirochaetales bacterium]|nr:alcohol dehydrogenase catalytic domain-containing protein [Spirochaetales bacterium]
MKAAVLTGPRAIEIQELATPEPGRGEVRVRLKYCGICTLEQRLYTGEVKIYYPIVPGHEAAGIIDAVGEGMVSDLRPGMPVALDLVYRCGECHFCRTGQSNLCLNRYKNGRGVLGGFAEYIVVSSRQVFPVPESMPLRQAAFAEPLGCCIRSLKKIGLSLSEDLLIIGAGPMGLMHLVAARCFGARIIVSDPNAERLAQAAALGADVSLDPTRGDLKAVIRELTGGKGVDACILTSPAEAALQEAIDCIAVNGRINIYTSYNTKPALPIDANTIHKGEALVTGSEGRTEKDFLQAVRLLSFGKVQVEPLISELVGLAAIEQGLQDAQSPKTYRVLLDHEA